MGGRQAGGKGLRPAGRIGGVAGRGPQIGAQEPAAAAAVEKEDLRRIAVRRELIRIARLEFGDDAIGEEAAVARKAGKEVGALRQAGFVGEIDAASIGRASCRERLCQYVSIWVVAVAFKKNNNLLITRLGHGK